MDIDVTSLLLAPSWAITILATRNGIEDNWVK